MSSARRLISPQPVIRAAGIAILISALAACGSNRSADQATLPPAPLPSYGLGDSYQFSDGSYATVATVGRDNVRWRSNDGNYDTSRDVLLPRLDWTHGSTQEERRIDGGSAQLFPLQSGKSVQFAATHITRQAKRRVPITVREDWRCEVGNPTRIVVPAGQFDTWPVGCVTREMPEAAGGPVQRMFHYAPDVGFYVRVEEHGGARPARVAELTSYTVTDPVLADTALRRRAIALQRTLEGDFSGRPSEWTDAATGDSGEITVLRTMQSEQHGWCREFGESVRSGGRLYKLHGTGCRNPARVWEIVLLYPGAAQVN